MLGKRGLKNSHVTIKSVMHFLWSVSVVSDGHGKSTILMVFTRILGIFHGYVSLPEGTLPKTDIAPENPWLEVER